MTPSKYSQHLYDERQYFEFVSPLPLEECMERLRTCDQDSHYSQKPPRIEIIAVQSDIELVKFNMWKQGGSVIGYGELDSINSKQTLIRGHAKIALRPMFVITFLSVIGIAFYYQVWWIVVAYLVGAIAFARYTIDSRDRMIEAIAQATLSQEKPKAKRKIA